MRITFICIFFTFQAFTAKGRDLFAKVGSLTEEKVMKAMSSVSEKGSLTEKDIQRADTGLNTMILRKLKHVHTKSREYKKLQDEFQENQQLAASLHRKNSNLQTSVNHAHPFFTSALKEKEDAFDELRQRLLGYNNRAKITGTLGPYVIHWQLSVLKERVAAMMQNDDAKFNAAWTKLIMFFSKVDGYVRFLMQSGNVLTINSACRCADYPTVKVKANAHLMVFVNVFKNLPPSVNAQAESCNDHDNNAGALRINHDKLLKYLISTSAKTEYAFFVTIMHELFHLIGFEKRFKYPTSQTDASNLDLVIMQNLVPAGDSHANEYLFPHDIMVPRMHADHPWELVVTTFTLRHLELVNEKIVINHQYMSNDTFFNHLSKMSEFINYSCPAEDTNKPLYDIYCPANGAVGQTSCLKNRLAYAKCTGRKYANGCGVRKIEKHCIWSHDGRQDVNGAINHFGLNSRCFDSSNKGAICLEFKIENEQLYIKYDTEWQVCQSDTEELTFKKGVKVTCSNARKMQNFYNLTHCQKNCSGNGFCVNSHCVCFPGYSGNDCGTFEMPNFVQIGQ